MAFTKEEAATVKEAAELIKRELTAGEEVTLYKFGSFKPKVSKARKARNPQTGEIIDIDAKKGVKFSASKVWLATL
jgi:integration host factor subunit beta